MLAQHGWPPEQNASTVTALIAGLEGALMLARVECNAKPVRDTVQVLCWMLDVGFTLLDAGSTLLDAGSTLLDEQFR